MTRRIYAHPLVQSEWPHIVSVPAYDFRIATADVHLGVYVRRVSGEDWHTLAGLVNHVVVVPSMRGRGLGGGAVADALGWLTQQGVPFALLHCYRDTAGFYERWGFSTAPNFPAPDERVSMVATIGDAPWPTSRVEHVERW